MSLKGSGLILLTSMFTLIFLTIVYVMVLLSSGAVMILLAGIFVGGLTLIWSILMVEYIYKVPVDNRVNY